MKKILLLLALLLGTVPMRAQQQAQHHRLMIQLASNDTLELKMLMKQLRNLKEASPTTEIEVVCHGPGLDLLVTGKSYAPAKITEFSSKGIVFLACENTMKDRKIEHSQLLKEAGTVPAAIIHMMERQEQGWSYIKAGF